MIEYTARITSQDTPRVGGRNLLLNSDKSLSNKEYYVGRYDISDPSLMVADEYYTIQIWGAAEGADDSESMWVYNSGGNTDVASIQKLENGVWQMTFKWRDDYKKLNTHLNLFRSANHPNIKKGYNTTIKRIKLERGTIATDWTPAPEDLDNRISNVSTSLTSLASTLLDPNEGDIPQLFRQQDQLANSVKDKADKLELANSVSSLQGEIDKRALGLHLDNAFAYIENIVKEIDSSRSYTISDSGYISSSVHNSCRNVSKEVTPSSMACRIPNTQPQIRLTLRSDHDALKRQVDSLTAQLTQLQATTKITPVLNTDTRKRSGSTTLYPRYGDWLLTSDSADQYISFSGLRAEIGRSIYIQTRRKAYLSANGHSFYGLPGSSTSVNQWLSNNTTYRFVRASATAWLVTSSSSPYPWT